MSARAALLDRLAAAYRGLLRAYSPSFRRAYTEEMVAVFRDRCARVLEGAGYAGLLVWIVRAVLDVAWNAPIERATRSNASGFERNVRFALRQLVRRPGFSASLVLTLALGIGATTSLYSLVDAGLLHPLPYRDADRLLSVHQLDEQLGAAPFAPPYLRDLRERVTEVESLAGFSPSWSLTMTGVGEPRRVVAAFVTDSLFDLLGARPLAGRLFDAAEHAVGGPKAALVSEAFWARHFGAGARLSGQIVRLQDEPYAIVGILPETPLPITSSLVNRTNDRAELWLPFGANPYAELRMIPVMNVIGRAPEGSTPERVAADLTAVGRSLAEDYRESAGHTVAAEPLRAVVTRETRAPVTTLFAAAAALLLIACANAAHLLMARATGRAHEMAVRRSVGAGRGDLVRQLLIESVTATALACVLGVGIGAWVTRAAVASGFVPLPPSATVQLNARVLAFATILTVATGGVFGLVSTFAGGAHRGAAALRDGGHGGRGGARLRSALVTAEVALATTLLVGAGLLARSFWKLAHVDPGFRAEALLQAPVDISGSGYPRPADRRAFLDAALGRLGALPGVAGVAAVNRLPLAGGNVLVGVEVEGSAEGGPPPTLDRRVATPGYFPLMGIPFAAGRDFGPEDRFDSELRSAIVNEAFARRFWPAADAVGRRVRLQLRGGPGPWLTVVGVAGDVRHHGLDRAAEPEIYVPWEQAAVESMVLVLRADRDPTALVSPVRESIWALDPDLALDEIGLVAGLTQATLAEPRFRWLVLNGFAAAALALAGIGIFGVISYSVAQRTRETGIRLALGARAGAVFGRVMGEGLLFSVSGVVLGLAGAWAFSRLLERFLFGIEPTDALTFVTAPALLLLVAVLAAGLPARRAARLDPVRALRGDQGA